MRSRCFVSYVPLPISSLALTGLYFCAAAGLAAVFLQRWDCRALGAERRAGREEGAAGGTGDEEKWDGADGHREHPHCRWMSWWTVDLISSHVWFTGSDYHYDSFTFFSKAKSVCSMRTKNDRADRQPQILLGESQSSPRCKDCATETSHCDIGPILAGQNNAY